MIERISPSLASLDTLPSRPAPSAALEDAGADFAAVLADLASKASAVVKHAEAVSIAGIKGEASVQQVVEAVMQAEQTLQGALAIRDKAVAAYLELSRMSI
jgi:flagellar hook-basal body complex protein FliE